MPPSSPRIPPVAQAAFTPEQKALVGEWSAMNFTTVIVEHPALYRALMPLIAKLISGSDLPPRDREVLVLRTLALCDETYEYNHHVLIARNAGLTDLEIEAARTGSANLSWFDRTLADAAEELVRDQRVGDETWQELEQRYSSVQLMEVVALVGGYTLMAMLTKSFGIELEDPETFNRFGELRNYT
jgi:4-carboxymuconolactone decarboxylase